MNGSGLQLLVRCHVAVARLLTSCLGHDANQLFFDGRWQQEEVIGGTEKVLYLIAAPHRYMHEPK